MSLNARKNNYMILRTPHMVSNMDELDENVSLDSTALERVKHTKFLGVLIDDGLTWKNHIDVSKKISRAIGVMNKLKGVQHPGPYFLRLRVFTQKIKQLRTKYAMNLVRIVPRISKITVFLQQRPLL